MIEATIKTPSGAEVYLKIDTKSKYINVKEAIVINNNPDSAKRKAILLGSKVIHYSYLIQYVNIFDDVDAFHCFFCKEVASSVGICVLEFEKNQFFYYYRIRFDLLVDFFSKNKDAEEVFHPINNKDQIVLLNNRGEVILTNNFRNRVTWFSDFENFELYYGEIYLNEG